MAQRIAQYGIPPGRGPRKPATGQHFLMKSKDGGKTWKWVANGTEGRIIRLFATYPLKPGESLQRWDHIYLLDSRVK